jgi:hypothetical protein
MFKTLAKTCLYMNEHKPNVHLAGRKAAYKIPDVMDLGQYLVFNLRGTAADVEEMVDQAIEEEDLAAELG